MTTALYSHPDCLAHVNPPGHPEQVARLKAIAAVADKRFAGKIVIYPQLVDLPLLSLDAVAARYPTVAAALGTDRVWDAAAERALLMAALGLRADPGGAA